MKRKPGLLLCLVLMVGARVGAQGVFPSAYDLVYSLFSLQDPNAGLTTFLSALIPAGGSAESMGMAFTAVADDASFLDLNPAASAVQDQTQFAFYHNNWIADTRIEGIAYTMRLGTLGLSLGGKWLYLPFTEYSDLAERLTTGYYSEAIGIANASIHLLARLLLLRRGRGRQPQAGVPVDAGLFGQPGDHHSGVRCQPVGGSHHGRHRRADPVQCCQVVLLKDQELRRGPGAEEFRSAGDGRGPAHRRDGRRRVQLP